MNQRTQIRQEDASVRSEVFSLDLKSYYIVAIF